jgi:hypothetical protein
MKTKQRSDERVAALKVTTGLKGGRIATNHNRRLA